MSGIADLEHVITVRLLSLIDDREWAEDAIAKRLYATVGTDDDKTVYAPLFEAAAKFWRELGLVVESGRTPTDQQAFAITYLRGPIEADVMKTARRAGAHVH